MIRRRLPLTDQGVILYIVRIYTTMQTKLVYLKHLIAILRRLQKPTTKADMYAKTLIRRGATVPRRQALPITRFPPDRLTPIMTREMAAVCHIAYKTASRVGEVSKLKRQNFIVLTPTRIVINWGQNTKTTKEHPFRPDNLVVIEGRSTSRIYNYISKISPGKRISSLTTQQVTKFLRTHAGQNYTSHSLKHGAIRGLMHQVAEGRLNLEEVMRVSHHRQLATLIRYAGTNEATALALGTQKATQRL